MNFLITDKTRFVRLAYVAIAFLVALLAELLLWRDALGLGAFLLILIYVVGFTALAFVTGYAHQRLALWFLIPIFILAFDLVIYTNNLVQACLPLLLFVLLFVYSVLLTLKNSSRAKFYFKSIPLFKKISLIFKHWGSLAEDLLYWRKGMKPNEKYKKIAIGLVVSIPILIVFILLFSSADAVFQQGAEKIFSFKLNFDPTILWRIIRTILFTLLIGSFFYALLSEEHTLQDSAGPAAEKIDHTVATVVLTLVNILFLLFVVIQIRYLFGSHDYVQVANITFADYARRGFFELVWVMIFSAFLLLLFYRSASFHGKSIAVSILKLFLILQILVIAASSLTRMNLYQDEYGYTTLRLYVEWFIYFSGAMFLFLAAAIIKNLSFKKFFHVGLIFSLAAFTLVASLNMDGMISKKNIDRYLLQGKELDLNYLVNNLSIDAVPEIARLKDRFVAHEYYSSGIRTDDVNLLLLNKKEAIMKSYNSWPEFNLSAYRALIALSDFIK